MTSKPRPETTYDHLPFVTIDSESTKDIDDALYVEVLATGGYRVVVAIANPCGHVRIGSTEDEQARLMAATAYVRDRAVRRMLPPHISEAGCSLIAGKKRPAMVFDLTLSDTLEVAACHIAAADITVALRMSHADIPAAIADSSHPHQTMLALASNLSRLLLASRRQHGALALYDLVRLLATDEEGRMTFFHSVEEVIGYIIVQETMILVNHAAASWMIEHDIPALYRNHCPRLAAPRSDELATTIEGWIKGNSFDIESIQHQFSALAGKANYGASSLGHYGLSLPFYLHISSPLRRYADLVNMRQMLAKIQGKPLPYDKAALETMATGLNEAIERRKEERSESFKDAVRRHAGDAMNAGQLARLADHELRQAIKLASTAGFFPEALTEELSRRFDQALVTDLISICLLTEVGHSLLPPPLLASWGAWLSQMPARAVQLVHQGQQAGYFAEAAFEHEAVDGGFSGRCRLLDREGRRVEDVATGGRKRDAEQIAAVRALSQLLALPLPATAPAPAPGVTAPGAHENSKSRLLELCQQQKWPAPGFDASGKGPSHQMIFTATATIRLGDRTYVGTSDPLPTKKAAETQAAGRLLSQVTPLTHKAPAAKGASAGGHPNPVGALQEMAQKGKFKVPDYTIASLRETPPLFACAVTVYGPQAGAYSGEATTKQAAKSEAARKALQAIHN